MSFEKTRRILELNGVKKEETDSIIQRIDDATTEAFNQLKKNNLKCPTTNSTK